MDVVGQLEVVGDGATAVSLLAATFCSDGTRLLSALSGDGGTLFVAGSRVVMVFQDRGGSAGMQLNGTHVLAV